jgi:hypothetical protein
MIYQISYEIYRFEGKLIDRKTYQNLKDAFSANPFLNFPEPKSYYQEHKSESLFILICFGVCLVLIPFGEIIDGTILMLVFGAAFFGLFISGISQFGQYNSYQKAKKRQIKFFKELKDDIIQSESYEELIILQRPKINKINN